MPLSHSIEHYFKPKMLTFALPPILGVIPTSNALDLIPASKIFHYLLWEYFFKVNK